MTSKIKKIIKSAIMLLKAEKKVAIPVPTDTNALLKGKVALITGGSGGIGFAMAKAFVNSGCKVVIAGTKEEKLQKCCDRLKKEKGYIGYIILNVLDIDNIADKILQAADVFEEKRIDILVNAAGVIDNEDFFHVSEKEYDYVMDINTKGVFFMSQEMSKYMIEKHIKGNILNVSSSSALRPAYSPYRISKWAIKGLTLGLAECLLPHGIIVNAIAPGPVATGMLGKNERDTIYKAYQPSGRYAVASEIANLAVFMVSDMGRLIVGDTFYITGGSGTISYQY